MIAVEELANGIIQIVNRGVWDAEAWAYSRKVVVEYAHSHSEPVYLLYNLTATTQLEVESFEAFVTSADFGHGYIGMAIMVGRRAHLNDARTILNEHPLERECAQLRLSNRLDDAYRMLLDKQVMDRINRVDLYGG